VLHQTNDYFVFFIHSFKKKEKDGKAFRDIYYGSAVMNFLSCLVFSVVNRK